MATFRITWNSTTPHWRIKRPELIARTAKEGGYRTDWLCGGTKKFRDGDFAYLVRVGGDDARKGIFGYGEVLADEPVVRPHWDARRARRGDTSNYVELCIVEFVNPYERVLPLNVLNRGRLKGFAWTTQNPMVQIPADAEPIVRELWVSFYETA